MFYKIIINDDVVGAATRKDFVKWQAKHNIIIACSNNEVQYITCDGKLYRANWMLPISDNGCEYIEAEVIEITESEYDIIKEAMASGEDIVLPEPTVEEEVYVSTSDITLDFVKESKVNSLSDQCNQAIIDGIDVVCSDGERKHFSLEVVDQIKISKLYELVKSTNFLPYHADGEEEKIFPAEDIVALKRAMEYHIEYHVSYFNSIKSYISTLDDMEFISSIQYGDEIPVEYHSAVFKFMLENPDVMEQMYSM